MQWDMLMCIIGVILRIVKLNVDVLVCSEIDPGLEEAISTIIWVAPRLSAEFRNWEKYMLIFGNDKTCW